MNVGLLKEGDMADFIVVEDLKDFNVLQTYITGKLVAENGRSKIESVKCELINNFNCDEKEISDFQFPVSEFSLNFPIIEALDGQLITNKLMLKPKIINEQFVSDTENGIIKLVVINRYKKSSVAKAFVKGFGLKHGAIASSVAHDSHNIIAAGVDDESICKAVNIIIKNKGGISCAMPPSPQGGEESGVRARVLPLSIAGLMSNKDGYKVAEMYTQLDKAAKELGSQLSAPFMTLSFMALLVIPHLKLSDMGLFDGNKFELIR
jgi:adenine deaminase